MLLVDKILNHDREATVIKRISEEIKRELKKPIVITISWSHFPSNDRKVYRFDTNAEADAFLHGTDEAIGWLSYTIINRQDESIE
tara:strand:- start:194 stop:448 length:255 start_codon:yes stop_codon:yes gene_type:complete